MHFTAAALLAASAVLAAPAPDPQAYAPPTYKTWLDKVDDGNPHQWYHYKQVTQTLECNGGPCEMGRNDATSYGISWGADVSGDGWISAGFSVTKERQTGEIANCQSNEDTTKRLCVWWRTAHTAYTVQKYQSMVSGEDKTKKGDPYVIWSPNDNDVGSAYVCGRDDECKEDGAEFWGKTWEHSAPAGGPKPYPFDKPWQ